MYELLYVGSGIDYCTFLKFIYVLYIIYMMLFVEPTYTQNMQHYKSVCVCFYICI